jgi:mannose-1-phosphate guanylyltransferase
MMESEFFAVIMAGGGGTRLWPLSRRERPKQALRLSGDRTLFQLAIDRLLPIIPVDNILVATVASQAEMLQEQAPNLPKENFVLEPGPRGTASVIGLAAITIRRRTAAGIMACLTADHFIASVEAFRHLLLAARDVAERGLLVTLGIAPTYPSTGYGYIERGGPLEPSRGLPVYQLAAFHEKPELETAQEYVRHGGYSWNSGMFIWSTDRILDEMRRQMPDLADGLIRIEAALGSPNEAEVLEQVWQALTPQTIDYGIMEHAHGAAVIPAENLGWYDIGSWERLLEALPLDPDGNLILGDETLVEETYGSLVYQDALGEKRRLVATLGLRDIIIVDTPDILLVCAKERSEDVRSLVGRLGSEGKGEYL